MSKTRNTKRTDVHRYKVTSKSKTIYKLICLWSKSQSDRKQSIIFICELMRRLFGDRDLIASVMRSQNENALTAMREFTSDICVVTFNPKDITIPVFIDVAFYKDKYTDAIWYGRYYNHYLRYDFRTQRNFYGQVKYYNDGGGCR